MVQFPRTFLITITSLGDSCTPLPELRSVRTTTTVIEEGASPPVIVSRCCGLAQIQVVD